MLRRSIMVRPVTNGFVLLAAYARADMRGSGRLAAVVHRHPCTVEFVAYTLEEVAQIQADYFNAPEIALTVAGEEGIKVTAIPVLDANPVNRTRYEVQGVPVTASDTEVPFKPQV